MPGFDPKTNISTMEKEGFRFKAVGIDINHKEQAIEVARQLTSRRLSNDRALRRLCS